MQLKRYLLFSGSSCYPSGGWGDFRDSFDSVAEAEAVAPKEAYYWWYIVDSKFGDVVRQGYVDP